MSKKDHKNKTKDLSKIYFEKGQNFNIPKDKEVTVVNCDNQIIIKDSWRKSNNLQRYKRKDTEHYIDTLTDKLYEYSKGNKFKLRKEIVKAMNKLREIILMNFKGSFNELFITLTCKEKITLKQIQRHIKYFIRRLRKKYPKMKFEYIYKFERQENQNWHIHLLLKDTTHKKLFIPNEIIERIWNKGFTKTQRVYDGSSTAQRILTKEDEENLSEEEIITNDALKNIQVSNRTSIANYMAKTNQLNDFPRGERIYIKSNGIKVPSESKMKYQEAINKIVQGNYRFTYEETTIVRSSANDNIINKHKIEEYRKL